MYNSYRHPVSAMVWLLTTTLILLFSHNSQAGIFVYCSAAEDKAITVFRLNESSGELSLVDREWTRGEPGFLTSSPDRKFLFASLRSTGQLAAFKINKFTGTLSPVNVVNAGADPSYLYVDKSGNHLFTSYYKDAKISVHQIDPHANISHSPLQEFITEKRAHAITPDPTEKYFYVPHTKANRIHQFSWDKNISRLANHRTPFVQRPLLTGPRHMVWHPNKPIAYINNEQGSSVTVYQVRQSGTLVAGQTVSTLPPNWKSKNSNSTLRLHPNGRWLYAANRGHNSIALLELDETGLNPIWVATEHTENTPRSFDIDPTGKFLLAGGQDEGRLAIFKINEFTGRINRTLTYRVGPKLWWVEIVHSAE